MPLIKSISGFRGTIGGRAGSNLTPEDIVSSVAGYGDWLIRSGATRRVVIGRDGRPSGPVVSALTAATLQCMGIDVIDCGFATTPTVEMAVVSRGAGGGIILSASHNPKEYNALKLLNHRGEFISHDDGQELIASVQAGDITYVSVDELGSLAQDTTAPTGPYRGRRGPPPGPRRGNPGRRAFRVILDAVNSVGAISIPPLCQELGVECEVMNGTLDGQFAHNPEPLPGNLTGLTDRMKSSGADLGIAVDPDVDRLALVGPGGRWIGEGIHPCRRGGLRPCPRARAGLSAT